MPVSVNVAGRQFIEGDLEAEVFRALEYSGVPAELLELELTETSLMVNTERTVACLRSLRDRDVHISIDDFGTGYSSLAYLRRFPIDKLKIDMAFIRDVITNPDDAAIVRAIINMAHSLNLIIIAEGVETAAQLNHLRRHHCDQIQGYLFSRPLSAAQTTQLLLQRKSLPPPVPVDVPEQALLIVDDEPYMRELLQTVFEGEGYHVLAAASAAAGFEMLANNDVHVILCDQHMPEMQGIDFFELIKLMYPATVRIVLTRHTELELMMAAVNSGAVSRYYTKLWDNEQLLENVRSAFQQHRAASVVGTLEQR